MWLLCEGFGLCLTGPGQAGTYGSALMGCGEGLSQPTHHLWLKGFNRSAVVEGPVCQFGLAGRVHLAVDSGAGCLLGLVALLFAQHCKDSLCKQ